MELEVLTSTGQLDSDPHPRPTGMLELLVDGALAGRQMVPVGNVLRMAGSGAVQRLIPGEPGTVRFARLPAGMKDVELWLPQQTPTELVALRADGDVLAPLPDGRRRWVHHGSSISHCIEAAGRHRRGRQGDRRSTGFRDGLDPKDPGDRGELKDLAEQIAAVRKRLTELRTAKARTGCR
ncbi:hypothetical protein AB0M31_20880 [Streptomyces sp. NPDC051773]|uniref:hypothetical protein n=1 Tax=Streptomyces sp. NPDC051773 TaxID=3156682 RepID=UPI0034455C25